jgi:hypothetical protein
VEPKRELALAQKAKLGIQASAAVARNPKLLIALVKYKLSERKQRRGQPDHTNSTDRI